MSAIAISSLPPSELAKTNAVGHICWSKWQMLKLLGCCDTEDFNAYFSVYSDEVLRLQGICWRKCFIFSVPCRDSQRLVNRMELSIKKLKRDIGMAPFVMLSAIAFATIKPVRLNEYYLMLSTLRIKGRLQKCIISLSNLCGICRWKPLIGRNLFTFAWFP